MADDQDISTRMLLGSQRLKIWLGRPSTKRVIAILGSLAALSAVLAVNAFPVVADDSLIYLDHSRSLTDEGTVTAGFRQIGYPLFLAVVRNGVEVIGAEPLIMTALLQRLLLVTAGVLAWLWWRWWSLPLLVFMASSQTIAYTNFLLNEGLALPLALLIVFPTSYLLKALRGDRARRDLIIGLTALVAGGALFLFLMRFTYIVFAVIPAILVIAGWRSPFRRPILGVFILFALSVSMISLAMSYENDQEYGIFFPAVGGDSTRYYYAWMQVFRAQPENRERPELAVFYNEGRFRDFINRVGGSDVSFTEKAQVYEAEVDAMLAAAGMSKPLSQAKSMVWALAAGRVDDIQAAVDRVTSSTRQSVDPALYRNQYALRNGNEAFEARYNDGLDVGAVITDPIGRSLPIPSTRRILQVLSPLALLMMAGMTIRHRSLLGLGGLLIVVGYSIGLGSIWADNLRFLMPVLAFGLAVATAVAARADRGDLTPA